MNELIVLGCILFLLLLGFVIIRCWRLLPDDDDVLYILGTSFGLGSGLITLQLYLMSRLGISWNIFSIFIPWALFLAILFIWRRPQFIFSFPHIPRLSLFEKALFTGIFLTLFYVLFESLLRPLVVWDGWATWMLESKVFFLDGKISYENLQYMSASYPVLYPLLGSFIYITLGSVDDTAVLLLSFAFYFFLSLSFFAIIKKEYGLRYALFWTFILMTVQNLIRHGGRLEAGIADLPQGYYIFISTTLFLKYLKLKSSKIILLLVFMIGLSGLIKNEGTPFLFFMLILLSYEIYKQKIYAHFVYLIIPLVLWGDWQLFKKMMDVDKIYAIAHPMQLSFQKTRETVTGVVREFITIKSWNVIWILYFVSSTIFTRQNKTLFYLHAIILFQLGIYLLVYLTTYGNTPESSFPRLLIHVVALAVYVLAVQLKEKKNSVITWLLG